MPPDDDSPSSVSESHVEPSAQPDAAGHESSSSQTDVSPPSSSGDTGKDGESRESLLSTIQKAVSPDQGDGPDGDEATSQHGTSPAQRAEMELPEEISPEELETYRPRTRKRIEQLMSERQSLRTDLEAANARAQATVELQNYLRTEDISRDDFGLLLDLASAMRRGNFQAFLEGVAPYVRIAQESLGIVLPPDLQQAVQGGHMTSDAARYVAQQRTAAQIATAKAQRYEQQHTVEEHTRAVQTLQSNVESAVVAWEKGIKRSDPDYAQKEPLVRDLLPAVVQERGAPTSEAEAIAIAEAAYARANAILGRVAPRPQATRQVPTSISRVNGAVPAPTSMLEAAQQALARNR